MWRLHAKVEAKRALEAPWRRFARTPDAANRWGTGRGTVAVCVLTLVASVSITGLVHAEDVLPDTDSASSNSVLYVESAGLEQLKEQKQIVVDTNAPVESASTKTGKRDKDLEWKFSWEDWDGLHFLLKRRTLLGQQFSGVTNLHTIHLEESRMAGKIGAKIAVDAAAFLVDPDLPGFDDGVELRRARLYAKGDCLIILPVSYEFEVGYVPHEFYMENSYLEFHHVGFLGTLKGGQFQVPMSMINYGSSRDMMFMESATPLEALAPGVNAGVQVGRPVLNERMTWAFGLFTDAAGYDFGDATAGFGRAVWRITGLPIFWDDPKDPDKHQFLHLGFSGTSLYAGEDSVRYQSRPESHLAPFVVDTGDVSADGATTIDLEVAWVRGPFCLLSEYLHTWVHGTEGGSVDFSGFYISASWMLTGESRPYDKTQGTFSRLIPRRNFNPKTGAWGAWELAGRVSHLDLNSDYVSGGRITMFMAGVNWYLNSHVKCRFDYGIGDLGGVTPDGYMNIFQTRFELDF